MNWLANLTINRTWLILTLFLVLTILIAYGCKNLTFDNSFDVIQPSESELIKLNKEIDETFGKAPNMIIALLEGNIYTPDSFERIRQITKEIENIEEVIEVFSIANTSHFENDDGFLNVANLVPEVGEISEEDVANIYDFLSSSYLYKDGLLISEKGNFATILIEINDGINFLTFNEALQKTLHTTWDGKYYIVGEPIAKGILRKALQRDLPLLTILAASAYFAFFIS